MTVSMICRILVIISSDTLSTPIRHPLGEENFFHDLKLTHRRTSTTCTQACAPASTFYQAISPNNALADSSSCFCSWGRLGPGLLDLIIGIRAGPLHGSGERNREAILAEFFEGDLGEIAAIKNVGDGVAHIEHERSDAAVLSSSGHRSIGPAFRTLPALRQQRPRRTG